MKSIEKLIEYINSDIPPNKTFRHEFKYEINSNQLELLKFKIPTIMNSDAHTKEDGSYQIRSLYFDDYYNSCYYENENGTDPREKFRIRIYNGSSDFIKLEQKRKEHGKTFKSSCRITKEQVTQLIEGKGITWDDGMNELLKKLYVLQETKGMQPKVIVEYDRIPFIYKEGNVRATLDLDIRTSTDIGSFLEPDINCRLIMPEGVNLLEVKYDEFLPDYIYRTLQLNLLRQTTFSKYYLCRKFGGLL